MTRLSLTVCNCCMYNFTGKAIVIDPESGLLCIYREIVDSVRIYNLYKSLHFMQNKSVYCTCDFSFISVIGIVRHGFCFGKIVDGTLFSAFNECKLFCFNVFVQCFSDFQLFIIIILH